MATERTLAQSTIGMRGVELDHSTAAPLER
jgi:hypothetical protein